MAAEAPLSNEGSAEPRDLQVSSTLPSEVAQCLQNARFVRPPPPPPFIYLPPTCKLTANLFFLASPGNMHESLPPRLPDELHLPAQQPLLHDTYDNYDHKPFLQENPQFNLEPTRLASGPRLGLPPTANYESSGFHSSRRPCRLSTS